MRDSRILLAVISVSLLSAVGRQDARAQEGREIPTFREMEAVAGASAESQEFSRFLKTYDFTENPKRKGSWGSAFGVFLERGRNGTVSVGIRPPSKKTNLPTYPGELPRQLQSQDTIMAIRQKLGDPQHTAEPEEGYVAMTYDGYQIIAVGGRLFEIRLTAFESTAQPNDEPRSRFGNP